MSTTKEMPEGLLEAVKARLHETRSFAMSDNDLIGIITRGMAYLDNLAEKTLDYTAEAAPRELLLEYSRYVWSDALDEFETNYLERLRRLQIDAELGKYDPE